MTRDDVARMMPADRDRLRDAINDLSVLDVAERYLAHAGDHRRCTIGGASYVCPICSNGESKNGTGIHVHSQTNRLHSHESPLLNLPKKG